MKLRKVYQAQNEIDASLIIGYLKNNGIENVIESEASANTPPMLSGDARSTVMHLVPRDIFVPENVAEEAIALIQEVR